LLETEVGDRLPPPHAAPRTRQPACAPRPAVKVHAAGVGRDDPRAVHVREGPGEADGRERVLTAWCPSAGFDDRPPDRRGDGDWRTPGCQAQHPSWFAVRRVVQILEHGPALRPGLAGRLPQPGTGELL